MAKPVGSLKKVDIAPVGKIHKTGFKQEIQAVMDSEWAVRSEELRSEVVELIPPIPTPTPPNPEAVESKPELQREDVVELVKENYPSIDDLSVEIMRKLPPPGGGNSWTVSDMPGFKKASSGYVFGILNKKPGFYDPTVLGIISGGGDEVPYTRLVDTDGNFMYIGEANPGTAEATASWRIKRVEFIGDDIEIKWANGASLFDRVWTNRASETYS